MLERRSSRISRHLPRLGVAVSSLVVSCPTWSDTWRIAPSASATTTITNNSGFSDNRDSRSDVVLGIAPQVDLFGEGGRYLLEAGLGVNALTYIRNTHDNEVLPQGNLKFKSTLVDRWVYFDTNARVAQEAQNAFLGRVDANSSTNRVTTIDYDIAPYVSHDFSPTLNLTARTQWSWSRREKLADASSQNQQIRLEQNTSPLGMALAWTHQKTVYEDEAEDALDLSAIRAVGLYSPEARWKIGLIVGRERNEFADTKDSDSIVGASVEAAPTERTIGSITVERRFFGTGWSMSLRHRSPFLGLAAQWSRQPTALANTQDVANGVTTAQLLDAMLITRHPDAAERAEIVRDTIARLALPRLGGPTEIGAQSPQLAQSSRLTAVLQGRLTTLSLMAYFTQLSPLERKDGTATPVASDTISSRQHGFAVDLNRRLNPLTAASVYFEASRISQIDRADPDSARDRLLRFTVARDLDPKTTASVSVQRRLRSTVAGGEPGSIGDTSLVVGLNHRF